MYFEKSFQWQRAGVARVEVVWCRLHRAKGVSSPPAGFLSRFLSLSYLWHQGLGLAQNVAHVIVDVLEAFDSFLKVVLVRGTVAILVERPLRVVDVVLVIGRPLARLVDVQPAGVLLLARHQREQQNVEEAEQAEQRDERHHADEDGPALVQDHRRLVVQHYRQQARGQQHVGERQRQQRALAQRAQADQRQEGQCRQTGGAVTTVEDYLAWRERFEEKVLDIRSQKHFRC